MKWEYLIKDVKYPDNDIGQTRKKSDLEDLGREGWELVSVDNGIAYFKRLNQKYIDRIIKAQMGTPPDFKYAYETVQDGYVIYDLNEKIPAWKVIELLNDKIDYR